jgi:hypothetical protein
MSDEEFWRIARRVLASQRRAMEEQQRFDALPLIEQRIRTAVAEARTLLERGAPPELVELRVFDELDIDGVLPLLSVIRRARKRISLRCLGGGTHSLVTAQMIGAERGARIGAEAAERFRIERESFVVEFTRHLFRCAGVEPDDIEDDL